ncbi:MAG: bifunctional hydroxymethylpyrimidine kinase/phosphomethylpyrimidine kinase [Methanothrix sp.]|nr:bifunctional hydroxymethylpyrimidine kinase/phosphomethylpyrimidine kinase [Methanothrix sp.]
MTKVALTIGGSDSGGGAGIQADIKTFSVLGLHGTCAITAITAQNTLGVQHVFSLGPDAVRAQLQSITDDFTVAAAKTGMLFSAETVETVADILRDKDILLVIDPVIEAEAGGRLLHPEAVQALKDQLLPLADVVTPNIFEAEALSGVAVRDKESAVQAAGRILDAGAGAVIVKGGHLDCTDLLATKEMSLFLPGKRVAGENHGVGCTYSAALTAYLASGASLPQAARQAKRFAEYALSGSMRVGKGVGPVSQAAGLRCEAKRYRSICNVPDAPDYLL